MAITIRSIKNPLTRPVQPGRPDRGHAVSIIFEVSGIHDGQRRDKPRTAAIMAAMLGVLVMLASTVAQAATIIVNSTADDSSAGHCTLRADHHGGGIYNLGTLTITNSTFSGNHADYPGGGIFKQRRDRDGYQHHLLC